MITNGDRPRPNDPHGQSAMWQAELGLLEHISKAIPDPDDLRVARGWLDLLLNLTDLHSASDTTAVAARALGMTDDELGELFEAELERTLTD